MMARQFVSEDQSDYWHVPVLIDSIFKIVPQNLELIADFTLGLGGHSLALLEAFPKARLIGFDRDLSAINFARQRLAKFEHRLSLVQADFEHALEELKKNKVKPDFYLADLGLSSYQLSAHERGFSFRNSGPLDMRMDASQSKIAYEIVNFAPYAKLKDIFKKYGEEPFSANIAKSIVQRREIKFFETTTELAEHIQKVKPHKYRSKSNFLHPATLCFQALRIYVNDELQQLENLLKNFPCIVNANSILAIISFHSLEDRIVKEFFGDWVKDCICNKAVPVCHCRNRALAQKLHKKPITADADEILKNPRSRSAKLRYLKFL